MIDFTVFEKNNNNNKKLKCYRQITNIVLKKKNPLKLNNVCSCNEQGYLITDQRSKLFFKASLKLYVMLKIFLTPTFFFYEILKQT